MAGASEMFDTASGAPPTLRRSARTPSAPNNSAFEDIRRFIMAGPGGATVDVDANADGESLTRVTSTTS